MAAPVKRPYHSPRRQAQARATRAAIRDAAHELFLQQGYAGTTIRDIADAAGVAPQTVYSRFGSKAAIVKELLDVSIAGDDEPIPVAERDWFTRVFDDGIDGADRLRRYAHACRRILGGSGTTFEIVRRGADGDPDLTALWTANQAQRRAVVRRVLDAVQADAPLRPELEGDRAVDVLYALHGPETFHLLVHESGWDLDEYEAWLADTFCAALLADG